MRAFPRPAVVAALVLAACLVVACGNRGPRERVEPVGATPVEVVTSDDLALDARLWDRGHERLVIYLHEFREDQSSWWPHVEHRQQHPISAMTLDFRGHGMSEGSLDDVEGMVHDVAAAIALARDRGFQQVMLVGAGMGAAVAIVAAVEVRDVTVIGFSTPADFDALDTVAVVELIADRVQLIAMRDDISAADSLRQFRSLPNVDSTRTRLYPGRSHGVAILDGRAGADARARFNALLQDFWVVPAGPGS